MGNDESLEKFQFQAALTTKVFGGGTKWPIKLASFPRIYRRKLHFEKVSFYPDGALGHKYGSCFNVEKQHLKLVDDDSRKEIPLANGERVGTLYNNYSKSREPNVLWEEQMGKRTTPTKHLARETIILICEGACNFLTYFEMNVCINLAVTLER